MYGPIGQGLIMLAFIGATLGAIAGFTAGRAPSPARRGAVAACAYLFAITTAAATIMLLLALVYRDFSVSYVAKVASRKTPLVVTITSLWAALEGSLLFYAFLLGLTTAVVTRVVKAAHATYTIAVMLAVGTFFAALVVGPASPFVTLDAPPYDGPGQNPLLQDHPLMISHPPLLYLGYVGMTVPFALTVAALLRRELSFELWHTLRRSLLIAFAFLTAGIMLGAFWAYEVLGWGGYWSWDPVENASLLPWLIAAACLHTNLAREREGWMTTSTLALAMLAFALTVLGAFISRGGALDSVHAFSHSTIGYALLAFLIAVTLLCLGLLATRARWLRALARPGGPPSKNAIILMLGAVVLVVIFAIVLLGTLFPLISLLVSGAKLAVGSTYFDRLAAPGGLLLLLLIGLAASLPSLAAIIAGAAVTTVALALDVRDPVMLVTVGLASFAALASGRALLRGHAGGHVAHLALALLAVSVCASTRYKQTFELALTPGQSAGLGPYRLTFQSLTLREEPHRRALEAELYLHTTFAQPIRLTPALRFYASSAEPSSSPATTYLEHRDVYVALTSFNHAKSRVTLTASLIPLVRYLFWAMPLMLIGIAWALCGRGVMAPPAGIEPAAYRD